MLLRESSQAIGETADLSAAVLMRVFGLRTEGTEARGYREVEAYARQSKRDIGPHPLAQPRRRRNAATSAAS